MEQRKEKTRATETAATKTSMKIPRGLRRRIYACRRAFRPDPDGSHESYTQKKARPKPGFSSNADSVFRLVVETVARLQGPGLAQGELVVIEEREIRPAGPVLVDRRLLVEQVVDDEQHIGLAVHERITRAQVVDHLRAHARLFGQLVVHLTQVGTGRAEPLAEQRGAEVAVLPPERTADAAAPVDALVTDVVHRILGEDTEVVIQDVGPAEFKRERANAVGLVAVVERRVDTRDLVVGRVDRTRIDLGDALGVERAVGRVTSHPGDRVLAFTRIDIVQAQAAVRLCFEQARYRVVDDDIVEINLPPVRGDCQIVDWLDDEAESDGLAFLLFQLRVACARTEEVLCVVRAL